MGPFPHDAPPAQITPQNPAGTDGFEFVEYAHPEPEKLHALFKQMGFAPVARHRSKAITLYRQGDVNYLLNEEPGSHGARFAAAHGPCAPSMAFRVADARAAFERSLSLGAEAADPADGPKTLDVPAIKGIGGSLLYFVDRYGPKGSAYDAEFEWLGGRDPKPEGDGLYYLDHLTHNVGPRPDGPLGRVLRAALQLPRDPLLRHQGRIHGPVLPRADQPGRQDPHPDQRVRPTRTARSRSTCTPTRARASSTSPAAAATSTPTIEGLRANGLAFMPSPPDAYYERVDERVPGHGEDLERLRKNGILIDGEGAVALGEKEGKMTKVLLQIFSGTVVGPIFFEFIQRKGDEGFGEGNFRALFVSIEEDQLRRGVLKAGEAAE